MRLRQRPLLKNNRPSQNVRRLPSRLLPQERWSDPVLLLTLRDLRHRFTRFSIVTLVAAVVFALLFLMNGLVEQFHREPIDTTRSFGAEQWVLATGSAGPFTSSASVNASGIAQLEAKVKSPIVVARATLHKDRESLEVVIIGHVPGALGTPKIVSGRAVKDPHEIVADRSLSTRIGDTVELGPVRYRVVGLTSHATVLAGVPLAYVGLGEAQDMVFGSREVVTGFLITGAVGALPPGSALRSNAEVADDTFHPLKNAIASVDLVRALLWLVAAVIIGAVVFLSALERQRDFAVLKAVGSTNGKLAGGLAIQAVIVALVAVLLAAGLQVLLRPAFPLRIRVPDADFWRVPLLASLTSLAAAAAGMRSVVRTDPASAFAGAGG